MKRTEKNWSSKA